ncbi:MAG: 6-hydroxymethylpterin diphosphokinase MptE-like protein, partial [Planctomycetota bacterium]
MASRSIGEPGEASIDALGDRVDRNLAALGMGTPELARRIAETPSRSGIEFVVADDGRLSGSMTDEWGRRCQLASRRRPAEEAQRLASRVKIEQAAVIVVNGFAMGHHVREVLARAKSSALVVVYEPDVALLRAVLERQDHSQWLWDPLLRFVTDAADITALGQLLEGAEGLVSLGVEILDHPPSEKRLGEGPAALAKNLADVVRSIRTNVITTLSQADVTIRNQLMNLDKYVQAEGIAPLQEACSGRPGIVISAGPSIRRNIHLIEQPWVRENVVLVAVQTMLKPLLERGIKPHFVTALDYHEISTRFYEGLTAADVEGITLIAEAKGNAAILEAWPGKLRCPADSFLDELLGTDRAERGKINPGATVAHLAYYVARYVGCDPVMLVGQDLGFTDGQYYGPNAAIHTVWGSELGEFCTLESLEWQRIKRMGSKLLTAADHLGRPMFTDEQMQTYRMHFEREFQADSECGLTIIDATEGGVEKAHTRVMPLAEALEPFRNAEPIRMDLPTDIENAERVLEAVARLRDVRGDVWKVADLSRRSKAILEEMIEHADDQPRVNELIKAVYEHRDTVKALQPAWELVQRINQRGTLKRAKADRGIHLADESPLERQRAQMRRDAENLEGLAEAADELGTLMDKAVRAHEGRAAKATREAPKRLAAEHGAKPDVWAAITVDPGRSDLGIRRDLSEPLLEGKSALRLTIERLARAKGIAGIALATAHPGDTARAAGIDPAGGNVNGVRVVIVETDDEPIRERRRAIRGARAFTPHQWRGGIAGWTYIDELAYPNPLCDVLETTGADALLLCGADWPLIDPSIGAQMIDRFSEAPAEHKLVFSQAAVGLSPALLERSLIESMRDKREESGAFASIGAIMNYLPIQPANDPIAGTGCIAVDPAVRDCGERLTADSTHRRALAARIYQASDCSTASAVVEALDTIDRPTAAGPEHLILNLVGIDGTHMDTERAVSLVRQAAALRDDLVVTLAGERGVNDLADALDHDGLARVAHAAAGAGALAVHARTPALAERERVLGLLDLGLDAVSIDVVANDAYTYELLTGRDGFDRSRENVNALLSARAERVSADGVPLPWFIARITRRDAIYEQIDALYDRWLLACGATV